MNWRILVFVCIGCLIIFSLWFYRRHPLSATAKINNVEFRIELALTAPEKAKGLGYRSDLPARHGMLFVYDHKEKYSFWMAGMRFPLDFVWIDANKIVEITKNIQPPNGVDMHMVTPTVPVDKILELNAGEVDTYNLKVGDVVVFNK